MKLKRILLFISVTIITIIIVLSVLVYNRVKYTDSSLVMYPKSNIEDTVRRIVVIGDSWAYFADERGFNSALEHKQINKTQSVWKVNSIGYRGAKSKDIFEKMVDEKSELYELIRDYNPEYAVVFCGINDQNGQYGPDFYAYHTSLILQQLIKNGIKPILLELPEWNIKGLYDKYDIKRWLSYHALSLLTSRTLEPTKTLSAYREALKKELNQKGLYKDIHFAEWITYGKSDIWQDDLHLNEKGYLLLADNIIRYILYN